MHLAILAIAFVLGTCASVDASPALIQPTHLVRVGDSSFRCQCDPTLTGSNVTAFRDCQRGTFTDKTIFTSGACQTFAESCSCQEISKLVRRVVNCDGVLVVPESRDQATATKQEEFMRESGFTADEETGKFPVDAELALSHYLDMHPSIDAFMLERGIVLEPKVSYPPEAEALFLEHSTILSDIGITANKDVFMANAGYLKSRAEPSAEVKAEYDSYKDAVAKIEEDIAAIIENSFDTERIPQQQQQQQQQEGASTLPDMFNPDRWQTKSDNSGPQSALVQPGAERKPPQRVRFSEYNEIAVIGMPFERKFATFPDRNNAREIPRTVNQLFRRIENVADTTGRIEFDQSISPEAKGKVSAIGGVLKSAIGVARGKVSRLANTVFSVMKMTSSSRLDQDATSIDAEFRRDLQSMTGELNSKYLESRSSLRETLSEDVFQRFSSRDDDDLQTQIQSILQMNVAN